MSRLTVVIILHFIQIYSFFFSFVQEVEQEFGLPVVSIVQLQHLIAYVKDPSAAVVPVSDGGDTVDGGVSLEDIEAYRKQYGVEYEY